MKNTELFRMLEIPDEVEKQLINYGKSRNVYIPNVIINKILKRDEWDVGIQELQELLEDDSDGIKILWELLNIISNYSYEEYTKRNISNDIFVATMKFCTRFLHEYHQTFQTYKFVWGWWFPRQISLNEYRIGALEYEFADAENREIAVHIPSDADLRKRSVAQSIKVFPSIENIDESLPERTTLQRKVKKYLLDGKKFGVAKGHLKAGYGDNEAL